jgi:hypothetical protein
VLQHQCWQACLLSAAVCCSSRVALSRAYRLIYVASKYTITSTEQATESGASRAGRSPVLAASHHQTPLPPAMAIVAALAHSKTRSTTSHIWSPGGFQRISMPTILKHMAVLKSDSPSPVHPHGDTSMLAHHSQQLMSFWMIYRMLGCCSRFALQHLLLS